MSDGARTHNGHYTHPWQYTSVVSLVIDHQLQRSVKCYLHCLSLPLCGAGHFLSLPQKAIPMHLRRGTELAAADIRTLSYPDCRAHGHVRIFRSQNLICLSHGRVLIRGALLPPTPP